jgi:hypothetical protein
LRRQCSVTDKPREVAKSNNAVLQVLPRLLSANQNDCKCAVRPLRIGLLGSGGATLRGARSSMRHVTRIVATAAIAVSSLLLGMRLSPQDPPAKSLAAERYDAVNTVMKRAADAQERFLTMPWERAAELETRVLWSRRLAEAAVDAGAAPARDAYAQHVARIEAMLVVEKDLQQVGRRSDVDIALVRFHAAEAKMLLERAK